MSDTALFTNNCITLRAIKTQIVHKNNHSENKTLNETSLQQFRKTF